MPNPTPEELKQAWTIVDTWWPEGEYYPEVDQSRMRAGIAAALAQAFRDGADSQWDNPAEDGTPSEHPAYRRGDDHGYTVGFEAGRCEEMCDHAGRKYRPGCPRAQQFPTKEDMKSIDSLYPAEPSEP